MISGDPCHTTRQAGPHRAVRRVEVRAFGLAGLDLVSPSFVAACPSTLLGTFGLHPILANEPSCRKHLWPMDLRDFGAMASSAFGPSPLPATTTSADFSLRRFSAVALSGTRRDLPR